MRYIIWPVVLIAIGVSGFIGWHMANKDAVSADAARAEADKLEQWGRNLKFVPVKFVIMPPPETPAGQTLYVSGSAPSLKAWAADAVPLSRQPDGTYSATLEGDQALLTGLQHEFKVTRGNWATVETDEKGQERANRPFTIAPDQDQAVVEAKVVTWRDGGKITPGRSTRTGEIVLQRKFHSDTLKNDRDIIIYLPPGYSADENADKRYPVLYMHDGQNLMDEDTSFKGVEWKVDETAEQLIKAGKIRPVIIVGVYNGGEFRAAEFTPPPLASADKPGHADEYGKLVVEQIKPMIDANYRTLADAADTFIAGSSQGGMVTLAMLKQYPDKFAGAALLTPWLQINGKPISAAVGDDLSFLKGKKIWIDMSDKPGDNYPAGADPMADVKAFGAKLSAAGLKEGSDYSYKEFPGAGHDEPAWQGRIDQVLLYLFGQ